LNVTEYIDAAKSGNESAFKKIVEMLEPHIAATVTGMLGKCQEAEDVGLETFIRLHRSLAAFRGDSSLDTYATRIAINLSINELKKRKRHNLLVIDKDSSDLQITNDDDLIENEELRNIINTGLDKLKPAFRSVIVLRLMNGYSVKETAEILKIAEGTVLSRLARAQKKLRAILSPDLGDLYG